MLGMCTLPQFSPPGNNALFEIARATPGHAAIPIFSGLLPYLRSKVRQRTIPESDRPEVPNLWYAYPWGYAKDHFGVHEIKLLVAETRKHKGIKKLENFVSPAEYLVYNNYTTGIAD
ncbi:hypothetical protein AVEN_127867-1 [Araneus ventricosus]|uniref:Uncharacterized protein n=1 Tax=Araneus ventricosus TaxID=182803 RepID=A0A4Y1ZZI5_ARAVE|nr:hypothetical protein AVEN_127867-1 [Araneus ventricosus]